MSRFLTLIVARHVDLDDNPSSVLRTWIDDWLEPERIIAFADNDSAVLSQADSNFDGIAIVGSDAEPMAVAIQRWNRILPTKFFVPILPKTTPAQVARLLNAGADAVLDSDYTPDLAVAYLDALLRRSAMLANEGNCEPKVGSGP